MSLLGKKYRIEDKYFKVYVIDNQCFEVMV